VNGVEQKGYDEVGPYLHFSNGAFAYKAKQGDRWHIVLNGEDGKDYDEVGDPVLSKDGKTVVYQTISKPVHFITRYGAELKAFDGVLPPVISPSGNRIAYGAKRGESWFYVVDEKEEVPFERVGYGYFSKDGKHFAYEAQRGDLRFVVIDGRQDGPFGDAGLWDFSPDFDIYTAGAEGKKFFVWHGQKQKAYESIGEPVLSPDGKKLAYAARNGEKNLVVVNGEEGKAYQAVETPVFSLDGNQMAYLASENGVHSFPVKNGKEENKQGYLVLPGGWFSPDGKQFAFAALTTDAQKQFIVLDGKSQGEFQTVSFPFWSSDGSRFAYIATRDDKQFLVINGREGERYAEIYSVPSPTFTDDGTWVIYTARSADRILRVENKI
jgi:Tol biopolymer transport system component